MMAKSHNGNQIGPIFRRVFISVMTAIAASAHVAVAASA
jgi:hypothetical protein